MILDQKLIFLISKLKSLEYFLDLNNWNDEDKILEYNELEEEIIDYLKHMIK